MANRRLAKDGPPVIANLLNMPDFGGYANDLSTVTKKYVFLRPHSRSVTSPALQELVERRAFESRLPHPPRPFALCKLAAGSGLSAGTASCHRPGSKSGGRARNVLEKTRGSRCAATLRRCLPVHFADRLAPGVFHPGPFNPFFEWLDHAPHDLVLRIAGSSEAIVGGVERFDNGRVSRVRRVECEQRVADGRV